ncbi:hypothetical protein ACHQM5_009409 [Ranunculus cassubicifolius]
MEMLQSRNGGLITCHRNHTYSKTAKNRLKQAPFQLSKHKNRASKSLPHELVIDILSRLPIKHLWKFRFVCKYWYKLLTIDHNFAQLHCDRSIKSNPNPSILTVVDTQELSRFNLHERFRVLELGERSRFSFLSDDDSCDEKEKKDVEFPLYKLKFSNSVVYGICNGLVCGSYNGENEVYIWNPFTKEHIIITYSTTTPRFLGYSRMTSFGFGYHQDTKVYKVVKVFRESDFQASDHHSHVSVYTLGVDSSWRDLELKEDIPCIMGNGNPLVNGVLHWLGIRSGSFSISTIVGFDLKEEVFREMLLPNGVNFGVWSTSAKLGELGGFLCLFYGYCGENVQIWAMNEYGVSNSWTKYIKIGRPEVRGSFFYLEPLGVVAHNGEIIVQKSLVELILYEPKTRSIRTLGDFGFPFRDAYTFIPSIISPKAFSVSGHIMRPWLLAESPMVRTMTSVFNNQTLVLRRSILEDQSSDEEFLDAPHASSSETLMSLRLMLQRL